MPKAPRVLILIVAAALSIISVGPLMAQTPANKAARAAAKAKTGAVRIPPDLKMADHIVYKQVGDTKLELMLFRPLEKRFEESPLVVYIHGGGWGNGDRYRVTRRDVISVVRALNQRGVTCASIEYRLANGGNDTVMNSVADCLDALSFLVKNAAEYGLDPARVATFGSSAGGHLSLMSALASAKDYPVDPSFDDHRPRLRCAVAYYPLTSLVHPDLHAGSNFAKPQRFLPILGGPLEENRDIARKLSPVELLAKDSPPLLLVHGAADTTLSHRHSVFLCERAKERDASAECLIVEGAGHGLQGAAIRPSAEEICERTTAFFVEHLSP